MMASHSCSSGYSTRGFPMFWMIIFFFIFVVSANRLFGGLSIFWIIIAVMFFKGSFHHKSRNPNRSSILSKKSGEFSSNSPQETRSPYNQADKIEKPINDILFCYNCGTKINKGNVYCPVCGTKS